MKLWEYIKALQKLSKEHWDNLELICSSDDEWNSFQFVNFWPELMFVDKIELIETYVNPKSVIDMKSISKKEQFNKVICIN